MVFKKASGKRSLSPDHDGGRMDASTVFRLASSSKLITIIAVLQAVDKGLIGLDDDVSPILPTLAKQEVLTGFRWYGKPVTKPREGPITLRHLVTNTAGTGYDFLPIQPLWRWRWWHGQKIGGNQDRRGGWSIDDSLDYPLLHEPGRGWTYGSGASWAGRVLETLSGMSLDDWIREHINAPLGLSTLTFFPQRDPAIAARVAAMNRRDYWTAKVLDCQGEPGVNSFSDGSDDNNVCLGGEGLYSSLEDFLEVLYSLLADDERLLSKGLTAEMFSPQAREGGGGLEELRQCLGLPCWISQGILKKGEFNWGIGGVLIDGDGHDYLKRGSLMWSGLYHLLWVSDPLLFLLHGRERVMLTLPAKQWMDREAGVCGIFGAQLVPAADKTVISTIKAFQKEVYRILDLMNDNGEVKDVGKAEQQNAGGPGNGPLAKLARAGKDITVQVGVLEVLLTVPIGSDGVPSSWAAQCDSNAASSSSIVSFLTWVLKLWRRA